MEAILSNFFELSVIARYLPDLLHGLMVTAELAAAVVVTGLLAGTALAVLRSFHVKPVNAAIIVLVDVLRALPPLMIIVVVFFGLPYLGVRLSGFFTSWLVLSLVLAAFTEELVWAGISSLVKGQWEAARSSGLTHLQAMVYVIVPQALRRVIAPLTSRVIATVKNTSLASVVGVSDLLAQASAALGYSANASPMMAAAIGYVLFLLPLVGFSRYLEVRYGWKH